MPETIGELLGLRKALASQLDLANVVKAGLPASAIDRVKESLDLPDSELTAALAISTKTLGRMRKTRRHLSLIEGDRLARLARLIVLANAVLEQPDLVREWFRSPQIGLNNQTPLEVMVTEAGAREVEDLLQRIEHGVLT
jgi:putative toxin-antitoxin system antitoxin component (TIGR02293 family)